MISTKQQMTVQARVKESALKYGNKAANLIELGNLCKGMASDHIKIEIPTFFPLSDEFIKSHLDKYFPNWSKLWKDFVEKQGESKHLTSEAVKLLNQLRASIVLCFEQHPIEVTSVITGVSEETLFMVRSTGEEDTVDIANPGGNESVAAVKPDDASISKAIGVVVASYLSEKSLGQRLVSGDSILKTPFMPVLLQTMIGEPLQGAEHAEKIVVSGVMYADGGWTRIDGAPGHGELIVNSKAPFDTYDVTKSGIVYPEIHHKFARLVPAEVKEDESVKKRKLLFKQNPKEIQSTPSLPPVIAKAIAEVGEKIKAHYDIPMDIEWVYQPWNKTLYIVQARPIPAGVKHNIKPSTISPTIQSELQNQSISINVVTPGGNAAKIITNKDQLLIASGIGDALKQYLKSSTLQDNTLAVIVKNPSPSTSHEAAQFSALGIPVIQTERDIEKVFEDKSTIFVIDPQRQQMLNVRSKVKNRRNAERELIKNGVIVEGLYSSSLSPKMTLLPQEIPDTHAKIIKEYLQNPVHVKIHVYAELLKNLSLLEATKPGTDDKESFTSLVIIASIFEQMATSTLGKEPGSTHQKLFAHAMLVIADIHLHLQQWNASSSPKTLLDLISKLKALVINPGEKDLYSDSIKQMAVGNKILRDNKIEPQQIDTIARPYVIDFLQLNTLALHPSTKNAWVDFVLDCCKTNEKRQLLAYILNQVSVYQLQFEFINQIFNTQRKLQDQHQSLLLKLKHEIDTNIKTYKQLDFDTNMQLIQSWEGRYHEWTDPAKFDYLYAELKSDFSILTKKLNLETSMTAVVKQVLLKQLLALTEMLDKTIKSLKGSSDYSSVEVALKVKRFNQLLEIYIQLMKQCMQYIDNKQYEAWAAKIMTVEDLGLYNQKNSMILLIENIFKSSSGKCSADQLYPSGLVSIESIRVGGSASLQRQVIPHRDNITAEDLFSWMHQNILSCIGVLSKDSQVAFDYLPEDIQKLSAMLGSITKFKVDLLNVSFVHPMIKLDYNIPLRNHSAKLNFEYNTQTKNMSVHGYFFGHNDSGRMDKIVKAATLERLLLGVGSNQGVKYNAVSRTLQFDWLLTADKTQVFMQQVKNMLTQYVDHVNYAEENWDDPEAVVLRRYQDLIMHTTVSSQVKDILLKSDTFKIVSLFPEQDDIIDKLLLQDQLKASFKTEYIYNLLSRGLLNYAELRKLIDVYKVQINLNYKPSYGQSLLRRILDKYTPEECLEILKDETLEIDSEVIPWRDVVTTYKNESLSLRLLERCKSPFFVSRYEFYRLLEIPNAVPLLKKKLSASNMTYHTANFNVTEEIINIKYEVLERLIDDLGYEPIYDRRYERRDDKTTLLKEMANHYSLAQMKSFLKKYKPDLKNHNELFPLCKGDIELAQMMLDLGAELDVECILSYSNVPELKDRIAKERVSLDSKRVHDLLHYSLDYNSQARAYYRDSTNLSNLLKLLHDCSYHLDLNHKQKSGEQSLLEIMLNKLDADTFDEILRSFKSKIDVTPVLINNILFENVKCASTLVELSGIKPDIDTSKFLRMALNSAYQTILDKYSKEYLTSLLKVSLVQPSLQHLGFFGLDMLIQKYDFDITFKSNVSPEQIESFIYEICVTFTYSDLIKFLEKYKPDLNKATQMLDILRRKHCYPVGGINELELTNSLIKLGVPLSVQSMISLSKYNELKNIINESIAKLSKAQFTESVISTFVLCEYSPQTWLDFIFKHADHIDFDHKINKEDTLFVYMMKNAAAYTTLELVRAFKPDLSKQDDAVGIAIGKNNPELLSALLKCGAPVNVEAWRAAKQLPGMSDILESHLKDSPNLDNILHEMVKDSPDKVLKFMETHFDKIDLSHVNGPTEDAVIKEGMCVRYRYANPSLIGDLISICKDDKSIIALLKEHKPNLSDCHGALKSALKKGNKELLSLVIELSFPKTNLYALDFFALVNYPEGETVLNRFSKDQIQKFLTMSYVDTQILARELSYKGFKCLMDKYHFKPDLNYKSHGLEDSFFEVLIKHFTVKEMEHYLKNYKPDLSKLDGCVSYKIHSKIFVNMLKLGYQAKPSELIRGTCLAKQAPELMNVQKNISVSKLTKGMIDYLAVDFRDIFYCYNEKKCASKILRLINFIIVNNKCFDLNAKNENSVKLFELILMQIVSLKDPTLCYLNGISASKVRVDLRRFEDVLIQLVAKTNLDLSKQDVAFDLAHLYGCVDQLHAIIKKAKVQKAQVASQSTHAVIQLSLQAGSNTSTKDSSATLSKCDVDSVQKSSTTPSHADHWMLESDYPESLHDDSNTPTITRWFGK